MRALSPEQKGEVIEKDEPKELQPEEGGSLFTNADVKMSEILSSVLSVDVSITFTHKWCLKAHNLELSCKHLHLQVESLMEMFSGGPLEHKVMQKAGCMDYSATEWELVGCNIRQRQTSYKFDKNLSRNGGEATTTQQKYTLVNRVGWAVEEVMTLQGVLLGDHFNVRFCFSMHLI
jgi:hypothetical protein